MGIRSYLLQKAAQALGINNDPNFGAGMQFFTPGQPIFSSKNYDTFVREGYKRNPTVYACINKIAGAASGINWKLYTDRDCKKTIDSHPLLDRWRKPNPSMPGTGSFIEQCFGFWHMAGNNYIYAYRPSPTSPPLALWTLRPDRMKAVAANRGIENYVYGYDTNTPVIYDLASICHMKFPGYDDDVYGLSPIQVASYFADQQNEAMAWNTALMQNAGRPASVFMSKGILTPEQRNQIREEVRKKYSGKRNAGRPLFLEADMTWQNMSLTPMELDFLSSFELSTRQICAIFDIAPELVGDAAGKTFANVDAARQALYLENTLPKLDRMSDYLNSWLVPMYPDLASNGAFFSYDKKDIEALQTLYDAQAKAKHDMARQDWLAGGITLAEYCEAIGAAKPLYGSVRRFGAVLVTEESLETYADQSLTAPAAPPMPVPEGTPQPGLPAPSGKQPALPAPAKTPKNPPITAKPAKPTKAGYSIVEVKELDAHGIYQPDNLQAQLNDAFAKGYTHVRWVCVGISCDECQLNDGVTVALGDAFPSGHVLPQSHPNCDCYPVYYTAHEFGKMRGQIHHEQNNIVATKVSGDTTPYDGQTMQLRFVPLQSRQGSEQALSLEEAKETTDDQVMRSGDVYRAFIGRYS